ncbi:sugar ABC transporter permease [Nocardioides aromaticivorans]|uniref:Autoinducer 2 import system permease protein LsrD n=1 Tax=Nocardioides aromaticivorans TaxID=200618 RepID=A0ABX7PR67_9ACTN|nr:ABC transporter permease [Nocardioides aromaticivorans]QSR28504.1 sugar ABC transporter permease [Nocardioides aromaticivorans]
MTIETQQRAIAGHARTDAPGGSRAASLRQGAVQSLGIAGFLLALVVVFSVSTPRFLTDDNLVGILTSVAFIGVVSLGQTMVIIAGGFDLSVAGVAPLAAVVYAQQVNDGRPILLAVGIALAAGAAVGVVNGLIVTKGGINPLITTLGMLSISGGIAFSLVSGQSVPIDDLAAGFMAETDLFWVPNQVWLFALAAVALAVVLRFTVYGRSLYAIGGNREAARLAGMRTDALAVSTYVASGAFAALGGVILASQLLAGDGNLGKDAALLSVAAVVLGGGSLLGGAGGALGTAAGVLVLGTLANGLTLLHVSTFYQQIATGAVLLVAVGFSRLRGLIDRSGR